MARSKVTVVNEQKTVVVDNDTLGKFLATAIEEGWNVVKSFPDGTRDKATRVTLDRDSPVP